MPDFAIVGSVSPLLPCPTQVRRKRSAAISIAVTSNAIALPPELASISGAESLTRFCLTKEGAHVLGLPAGGFAIA